MRSALIAISALSHRHPWRATVGFLLAAMLGGGCADGTGPGPKPDPDGASWSAIVSDPTIPAAPTAAPVAYVSLRPGSFPTGERATVTNRRTGASLTVDLVAGGLDPVAIAGEIGDTLSFAIDTGGARPIDFTQPVPVSSPPTVVRTEPEAGKQNVAQHVGVRIVFSEPVTPGTVTNTTLGLTHPGGPVDGVVAVSTDGLVATFVPADLLLPETEYTVLVRKGIRDIDGSHLEALVTARFTTGAAPPPPPPAGAIKVDAKSYYFYLLGPIDVELILDGTVHHIRLRDFSPRTVLFDSLAVGVHNLKAQFYPRPGRPYTRCHSSQSLRSLTEPVSVAAGRTVRVELTISSIVSCYFGP